MPIWVRVVYDFCMVDTSIIERNGKTLLLAYDQGFEHGPTDFNDDNVDPAYIMNIAKNGYFTGVIFQEGVAAKYYEKESGVPLIVKLNGATTFQKSGEPLSLQLCTVDKAVELGAIGVGYTIYVGSEHEEEMMVEFSRIEDEAHARGLIVIGWMYPRGKKVEGREHDKDIVAYAARLGMELNADLVKVPYTGDADSFRWVVESAGKTGVLQSGGDKTDPLTLEAHTRGVIEAGARGVAIGRNVWQDPNPDEVSRRVAEIVFGNESQK